MQTETEKPEPLPAEVVTNWSEIVATAVAADATEGSAVAKQAEQLARNADAVERKRGAFLALIAGKYKGTYELPALAKVMALAGLLPSDSDWLKPVVDEDKNSGELRRLQYTRLASMLLVLATRAPDALLNQLAFDPGANRDDQTNTQQGADHHSAVGDALDVGNPLDAAAQFSADSRESARRPLDFPTFPMTPNWSTHVIDLMALNHSQLRR